MTFLNNKNEPLLAAHFYFIFYPRHKKIDYLFLLNVGQVNALGDFIPFIKAVSAAASAGVLRYKNGMSARRGLLSVVGNACRGKPLGNECFAMGADGFYAFFIYVLYITLRQMKLCPEGRAFKPCKGLQNCCHFSYPYCGRG